MEDLFSGILLTVWKDDEWVYLSFPFCTVNIPLEELDTLMLDFAEFSRRESDG